MLSLSPTVPIWLSTDRVQLAGERREFVGREPQSRQQGHLRHIVVCQAHGDARFLVEITQTSTDSSPDGGLSFKVRNLWGKLERSAGSTVATAPIL